MSVTPVWVVLLGFFGFVWFGLVSFNLLVVIFKQVGEYKVSEIARCPNMCENW